MALDHEPWCLTHNAWAGMTVFGDNSLCVLRLFGDADEGLLDDEAPPCEIVRVTILRPMLNHTGLHHYRRKQRESRDTTRLGEAARRHARGRLSAGDDGEGP